MSDIMEKIDASERQKNKGKKKQRNDAKYSEIVAAKRFCCAFKLGFVQLICKVSLIFKSNLELALSIILKGKENYTSQSMLW